jgi:hypothetical protein
MPQAEVDDRPLSMTGSERRAPPVDHSFHNPLNSVATTES